MKLNLEIELDWIDDESNLDETVKQHVINGVVSRIQKKTEEQVEKKVNDLISSQVTSKIDEMTTSLFNDFMNNKVTLTDGYGSTMKVYDSVTDIIKERFDNFMEQPVDDKGRPTSGGYGTKYPRIKFIIDEQLKTFADKFTTDAVAQVSAEIKQHVKEGLTTKLGAELMSVLKVNEMLALPEKKK